MRDPPTHPRHPSVQLNSQAEAAAKLPGHERQALLAIAMSLSILRVIHGSDHELALQRSAVALRLTTRHDKTDAVV